MPAVPTMEHIETMPQFSNPGEMYARLGCRGCKHAINMKLVGLSDEEISGIIGEMPGKRVGESYSIENADLECGDRTECPFKNEITNAYSDVLSATS